MRRVKSEENVADLETKPLSKAVITKHWLALGYVDMAEENGWCKVQDVAMFRSFDSDPNDRDGCQKSQSSRTQQVTMPNHRDSEPAAATAAAEAAAASGRRAGDR